jgi:molecular chaperone DnaK
MPTPIIGIDLGTTYTAIATINLAGSPELIENSEGEKFTASAILFEADGPAPVGQIAINSFKPEHLEQWFKKKMGDVNWKTRDHFGQTFTALDLSGFVIKKVVNDANVTNGPISKAVITVPAYFKEIQRKATMDAAALAGIEVLGLVNEPTAAALAFANTGNIKGKCLVYDLGGGTFDVSVVDIASPESVTVISSEGDNNLGGHNFDKDIAKLADKEFIDKVGHSMLSDDASLADRHEILLAAEKIKRSLSIMQESQSAISSSSGRIVFTLTRNRFGEAIRPRIRQTELLVDKVLDNCSLTTSDIDHVLLVGGSTRIPLVQTMLERRFGKPPVRIINPDESVAMGAAIKAAQLLVQSGEIKMPDVVQERFEKASFREVTNASYGTFARQSMFGADMLRNTIIIKKDTPIPCENSEFFQTRVDNQTEVDVSVTQGEQLDPRFVETLWEGGMELPPNRPAGQPLKVTYKYDANQRMSCITLDVASGKEHLSNLNFNDGQSDSVNSVPQIDPDLFDDLVIE